MYILAINGSPRKNRNTAKLLQSALKGAEDCTLCPLRRISTAAEIAPRLFLPPAAAACNSQRATLVGLITRNKKKQPSEDDCFSGISNLFRYGDLLGH